MKRANWCWRSRLLLEGTFWSGMISLAFGIDESEFGVEALLLARAVITDWRIAKVIRLSQPPRGELFLPIDIRGQMSVTGLRQMGITAHVLILPGAAIDHNPLLCVVPPPTRLTIATARVPRHDRAHKTLQYIPVLLLALLHVDG